MSHIIGTVPVVAPPVVIGPDGGGLENPAHVWAHQFTPDAPPIGVTKFVMLHFSAASFPANNRLEVDLGYDTDVFTSADGADLWTRPVDIFAVGGSVTIRYITNGAATGSVTFDKYGRGERHHAEFNLTAISNGDPFLGDPVYGEPLYDPLWFCHDPPQWQNSACVPVPPPDIRESTARSVGMIVSVSPAEHGSGDVVSSCSVTLLDADIVITAGHCLETTGEVAHTASVIFNYATQCDGSRPPGYAGRFVKVDKQLAWRYASGVDYCTLRLKHPPGLPPITPRTDIPAAGEQIFGIHHPNGAVKKLSPLLPGFGTVASSSANGIRTDIDISGGSSGSGLFDAMGRITGVLAGGSVACSLNYYPTGSILAEIASPPSVPATTRDVMIVFDRSGSMSLDAGTGHTKMAEAQEAASLFVQLVRASTGNRVGLVSFSSGSSTDFAIAAVTATTKNVLTGPVPHTGGTIGTLTAGGSTSIGGGLDTARLQFPAPGANPRSILLMTDGLQNTWPMISDVVGSLGGIAVDAIGFGTESSLDGALLTDLANAHDGLYHRAGDPLALRKFFALAFGTIFEAGSLMDPDYVLERDAAASAPIPFRVCGEETVTIVAGWDDRSGDLSLRVSTPGGAIVTTGSPGVESSTGTTWTFMRIPLPQAGERDGLWKVEVVRPHGGGEFPPPLPQLRFFVSVIAKGGPRLTRFPQPVKRYFTGDTINPLVTLRYPEGGFPNDAVVKLTVTRPDGSVGTLLAAHGLGAPSTVGADTIPARQATLLAIEKSSGKPVVGYVDSSIDLLDQAPYNGGQFEQSGIFGNPQHDLLDVEGNYTFHAVATYGTGCVATREVSWAVHVDVGIDPSRTTVTTTTTGTNPDGTVNGTITITPRDRYGNAAGPGRGDGFTASGGPGTTVTGAPRDNGNGSYTIPITWDPRAGGPSVVVNQPGKDPVVVQPAPSAQAPAPKYGGCAKQLVPLWLALLLGLIAIVLLVLLIVKP